MPPNNGSFPSIVILWRWQIPAQTLEPARSTGPAKSARTEQSALPAHPAAKSRFFRIFPQAPVASPLAKDLPLGVSQVGSIVPDRHGMPRSRITPASWAQAGRFLSRPPLRRPRHDSAQTDFRSARGRPGFHQRLPQHLEPYLVLRDAFLLTAPGRGSRAAALQQSRRSVPQWRRGAPASAWIRTVRCRDKRSGSARRTYFLASMDLIALVASLTTERLESDCAACRAGKDSLVPTSARILHASMRTTQS